MRNPQVLDEIVQLLTEPRFMGKMVVILGGYEKQVGCLGARRRPCPVSKRLLSFCLSNSALASVPYLLS